MQAAPSCFSLRGSVSMAIFQPSPCLAPCAQGENPVHPVNPVQIGGAGLAVTTLVSVLYRFKACYMGAFGVYYRHLLSAIPRSRLLPLCSVFTARHRAIVGNRRE